MFYLDGLRVEIIWLKSINMEGATFNNNFMIVRYSLKK